MEGAMIRLAASLRILGLSALVVAAGTGAASSRCADLLDAFNRALEQRQTEALLRLEGQIATDAACGRYLVEVQRRRAALNLRIALEMMEEGSPEAHYEPLVVEADRPQVLWHAAQALGNLLFEQRRFVEAAQAYDRALEIINNPTKTPRAPDSTMIEAIADRFAYARQLAANERAKGERSAAFVPAARNRDGTVGGILAPSIRGFTPKSVPLPITFHTAQTTFTEIGTAAAEEFLAALREQRPETITIVGHADERGPHELNMRLSAARAEAVKAYLRDNGIAARVVTIGKGWTEPLKLPDGMGLTQEEIWALNRRVEWRRD
jgi:outer membrane protein OmpA-like peptidoglycan-associated protein